MVRQGEASSAGLEPLVSLSAGQQAADRWEGQSAGVRVLSSFYVTVLLQAQEPGIPWPWVEANIVASRQTKV